MAVVVKSKAVHRRSLEIAEAMLSSEEAVKGYREGDTLCVFPVDFGNGVEADIKICNGNMGPWVDAVLFDNGQEVCVLEPSFDPDITGEYIFEYGDDEYHAYLVRGS